MIRVGVGLSRKVSRDYQSTGFSINLDGEIAHPVSDAEGVIEEVKQLYDLAEEALNQEIDRYQSESALASHDTAAEQPRTKQEPPPTHSNGNSSAPAKNGSNGHGAVADAATNKQCQYLLQLSKRNRLTVQQLESRIEQLLGRKAGVYDLSKKEAGDLIDALSQTAISGSNGNGRGRN